MLTSFLNDVQTSVGYIVVLELVAFLECTDENRVVLGRYEGDCIQAEWRRHETRCRESSTANLKFSVASTYLHVHSKYITWTHLHTENIASL